MRDIDRIDVFCNELAKIWKTNFPDWRFGQLVCNFISWYGSDPFFLEEEQVLVMLNEFVKTIK